MSSPYNGKLPLESAQHAPKIVSNCHPEVMFKIDYLVVKLNRLVLKAIIALFRLVWVANERNSIMGIAANTVVDSTKCR